MANKTPKTRLASLLRKCRLDAGLTIREAASSMGWAHTAIVNIEASRRSVRAEELPLLAKLYSVPLERLAGEL